MKYNECKVLCKLERKKEPLVSIVPVDEYTDMVQNNFDYDFTGESIFYPYELPKEFEKLNYSILVITGSSGGGKSTLLKEFPFYYKQHKKYDCTKAIVSNFSSPEEASIRLSAVGLNSMPVWCRPRNVLSVGEGFRADLALNINSEMIFDEFTSTIDRNVAKSTCNSIAKFIRKNNMDHIVFCSCHNDYIPFLKPDFVIDIDEGKCFDCRGADLGEALRSKSTSQPTKRFGAFLSSITI
jgi:ABC-type polar amino acid transport system ATPase subunit